MKLLFDTHILLWALIKPERLPAIVEDMALITADPVVARYPGPVRHV